LIQFRTQKEHTTKKRL